jgi:hypothetical protein
VLIRWLRALSPLLLWLPFAIGMVASYRSSPPDPTDPDRYGTNIEGVLASVVPLSLLEAIVALVLLQTWRATPNRSLQWLAVSLALVWSPLSCGLAMHQGSVVTIHGLWTGALLVFAIVWYASGWPRDPRSITAGRGS